MAFARRAGGHSDTRGYGLCTLGAANGCVVPLFELANTEVPLAACKYSAFFCRTSRYSGANDDGAGAEDEGEEQEGEEEQEEEQYEEFMEAYRKATYSAIAGEAVKPVLRMPATEIQSLSGTARI